MLHDKRDRTSDHQQEGQPAETMMAMVMMTVTVVAMMVAPVPGTLLFPGMAALVRTAFVQREFIAHADIDFAHSIFPKIAATSDRRKNIIIKSSNINTTHQKIIMSA
jgi:hypothetical protein